VAKHFGGEVISATDEIFWAIKAGRHEGSLLFKRYINCAFVTSWQTISQVNLFPRRMKFFGPPRQEGTKDHYYLNDISIVPL
jgi:hypothetical protein